MTDRLFVAVWPDPGAKAALRSAVDAAAVVHPGLRWQPGDRWHITLAFLGDADPDQARRRLDRLTLPAPGPVRLSGAGSFGPVLWVGVEHGPWLTDLATALRRSLAVADHRFRAHLTVARARGVGPHLQARGAVPALSSHRGPQWTPHAITLVASHTGPQPRYDVLQAWGLQDYPDVP